MPISLSAKKSLRKSIKNHGANVSFKRKLKELVKTYVAKPTAEGFKQVQSMLDKAKKNHIYHKNKVARLKSELNKKATIAKKGEKVAAAPKKTSKKMS